MGDRAHYIIVEDGARSVFYSHWGGGSLMRDLFGGPAETLEFIRGLGAEQPWDDDTIDVSAVLVDSDNRVLLFFDGSNLTFSAPLRNLYLRMLSWTWPGWSVSWADRAMLDLVEYLGL